MIEETRREAVAKILRGILYQALCKHDLKAFQNKSLRCVYLPRLCKENADIFQLFKISGF